MVWVAVVLGGVLAGLIARAIVPGKEAGGLLADAAIGVLGGLIGKLIMSPFGLGAYSENPLWNLFVAVVGAVIVLFLYHRFVDRQTPASTT